MIHHLLDAVQPHRSITVALPLQFGNNEVLLNRQLNEAGCLSLRTRIIVVAMQQKQQRHRSLFCLQGSFRMEFIP